MMPSVLLIYDTLLTLGREVHLFWTGQMTGARILFLANRYISLLWNVYVVVGQSAPFSDQASYAALWLVHCKYLTLCCLSLNMLTQRWDEFLLTTSTEQITDEHYSCTYLARAGNISGCLTHISAAGELFFFASHTA